MENEKKVLLSIKDLVVKFHVRGRILTAIRGISLDIYENESIAIVGESGSGKSVFTKTFAGMLDSNGFIDSGTIMLRDDELAKTDVKKSDSVVKFRDNILAKLNKSAYLIAGAPTYRKIVALKDERKKLFELTPEEEETIGQRIADLKFEYTEKFNFKQTLDSKKEKELAEKTKNEMKALKEQIEAAEAEKMITTLMGDNIDARKAYISENANFNKVDKAMNLLKKSK